MRIEFVLNGKEVGVDTDPAKRLLDVLRNDFGCTGVKEGCGEGECGACAVLVEGRLVNSCILPVIAARGLEVITIEGFRETERYRVIEEAFDEAGAVQCGFCTPGFVLAAEALLRRNPVPDEEQVREGLSGNLCRCTGYGALVRGVLDAADRGRGLW